MSDRDDQFEQYSRERFDRQVKEVAQRLRDLAEEVDRIQTCRSNIARPTAQVVGDVIHAVQWGIANLPLQSLASTASDINEMEKQR